ncbi:MAG TPA: HAD family hydrolase [Gaiellales bacterium]|nr:HAD family hydrolase [Gaiellales bacterium]
MTEAILFDLDDTLVVEEPAAAAAFLATAHVAARRYPVDPAELARTARTRARDLWRAGPAHAYGEDTIGMSSWEALWCRWEGDTAEVRACREWAAGYRAQAWRAALAEHHIVDPALAELLGERFGIERRLRHEAFADARPALDALRRTHALALVTNGASCLQREKLAGCGLTETDFDAVVISGDLGTAKPDAAIFAHALDRLGVTAADAVMVGDSFERDIRGAHAAGIRGIWLNRDGAQPAPEPNGHLEIAALTELAPLIRGSTSG